MESRRVFALRALAAAVLPEDRAKRLQAKFIAPCCWSESVEVHRSESAAAMRAEIASLVESGQSDDAIIAHYVAIHGERILLEPRGRKQTYLVAIPIVALGAGAALLVRHLRRRRATPPAPPPGAGVPVNDEELEW